MLEFVFERRIVALRLCRSLLSWRNIHWSCTGHDSAVSLQKSVMQMRMHRPERKDSRAAKTKKQPELQETTRKDAA